MRHLLVFLYSLLIFWSNAQHFPGALKVIPQPYKYIDGTGLFMINSKTVIVYNPSVYQAAKRLKSKLENEWGLKLKMSHRLKLQTNYIYLRSPLEGLPALGADEYRLLVDQMHIELTEDQGHYYGIETLMQLGKKAVGSVEIPSCSIEDHPRFSWRGMHLDVSRHFVSADSIKKYIDYLAFYKMNIFHWHLTDDQGWRIEIKKYPKLTSVGAWRNGTLIGSYRSYPHVYDSLRYGGFYTQKEIKDIVKYASGKGITVVPEIEMPGHSLAALAAYPEYSCNGGPFSVAREWGVFDDVYCTKDSTFKFLENILDEVIKLFPSEYIHIGGDECPKERWKTCSHCQQRIKEEGLKDEHELQSWFIRRIEKYINSKGRKIIGWDEILEGGLAPNAAVMSWRGTQGGIEAATLKHEVVMTPGSPCYFDHYQGEPPNEPLAIGGYNPIEKIYNWNPVPAELPDSLLYYVKGAQGNVWTEYMPNFRHIEYMVLPRMAALAEVLWSPERDKNWDYFQNRLMYHFPIYEQWNANYSRSVFNVKSTIKQDSITSGILYELSCLVPGTDIFYTFDGSEPQIASAFQYTKPIQIIGNASIRAAAFRNGKPQGRSFARNFAFSISTGKKIHLNTTPSERYNYGGAFTLCDGYHGTLPWTSKDWLGFKGTNLDAVVDLGDSLVISSVAIGVLDDKSSWIHPPAVMECQVSNDSLNWVNLPNGQYQEMDHQIITTFESRKTRYIRVLVRNTDKIPDGFPGATQPAWLFADEIIIQ